MERFARMIEAVGADVVLVQEVVRTSDRQMDHWLAERLGMGHSYTRANGHQASIGFEEGLAVYSRFPLLSTRVRRLEPRFSRFVNRLALGAELLTPFGSFWAFSVHLGLLQSQNASQLHDLHQWVTTVTGTRSAVIGGDFNAAEHTPQIQAARRRWLDTFRVLHPLADATTHILRWPWGSPLRRSRLDYLFLHRAEPDWQVVEARNLSADELPVSDHRAVLVRISMPRLSPV
jgi:endonuclease/exonuclease/phosphatase family metal-dependent hydrolase